MSLSPYAKHMPETSRRSTWWVARGSQPRPWWLDSISTFLVAAWATINYLLSPSEEPAWILCATWMVHVGVVAWGLWCHRTGRDPGDTRLNRWAEAHPGVTRTILVALVVCLVGVAIVRLD